ncbi:tight adherence protein C [Granulicella pectinivorans]|uniref:Tight adherence protein C n=1 Tax=Granulicella pectinivorans TaxID=474950 RepID=A0A1I6MRB4_9BACT|nr:type II secretion system F family protein [Granulicella pectinivorans]SFS18293.1 tight adherence protein C [Granulicella pectinivorans]
MTQILFYVAVSVLLFSLAVLLLSPFFLKPSPEARRVHELVSSNRVDQRVLGRKERFQEAISSLSQGMRSKLKLPTDTKSLNRLAAAGIRNPAAPDIFMAAQFLLPLGAAFAASFIPTNTLFWAVSSGGVAYLLPGMWLTHRVGQRKKKIRSSLPDVIDLLVICVDAGLGLDQAVMRVCEELALNNREIQEELSRVQLEQRAGKPRLDAWQNMATRVKVDEVSAFTSMLVQTDRFGTPIARALSGFASELRVKRRQRAEEAAAKTKIKIIFPLVLCIFPCLFIVLLAPALLAITRSLANMGK